MLAEGNLTYDNDHAGIHVYATANAHLRNNTLVNDYVELKDKRPEPFLLRDLTIENNKFKNGYIIADTATVNNYKNENFVIDNNRYDNNGGTIINWNGKKVSTPSAAYSSFGLERNGVLGSVTYTRV
jgi:parallel beta-helix repeat protein